MKRQLFRCVPLAVLAVLVVLAGGVTLRGDDKDPFEAYEKAARPGPEHKVLEALVGSWEFTGKFWMDPSKPPMENKGTSESKWILDGRFVEEEVKSELFGKPFVGRGLTGFDKAQGKYTGTWIDSMSTGISTSVGTADKDGKVLSFTREDYDGLTKKKNVSKDVLTIKSNDEHVMESYKVEDGKEFKMMEISYKRKKK
jgi:Protein of unknown function (DUF1579)